MHWKISSFDQSGRQKVNVYAEDNDCNARFASAAIACGVSCRKCYARNARTDGGPWRRCLSDLNLVCFRTIVGPGVTCITLTATDAAGNTSTCKTCVTVIVLCIDVDFLPTALIEGTDLPVHFQAAAEVRQVILFVDGEEVGRSASAPFEVKWTKIPAGIHTLWGEGLSSTGESSLSEAVVVLVSAAKAQGPRLFPGTINGQIGFALQTMPGEKCFIESTDSLNPAGWKVVEETVGDGLAHWYAIQNPDRKAAFYRVRLEQ